MEPTIKFQINSDKSQLDIQSIEIYRAYQTENNEILWGYIDSLHPMSKMELLTLRNFLQEYLQNNDWY
jgi:hypothetical protein